MKHKTLDKENQEQLDFLLSESIARSYSQDVITLLLKTGANINAIIEDSAYCKVTPMSILIRSFNTVMVQTNDPYLYKNDYESNVKNYIPYEELKEKNLKLLKFLLDSGADTSIGEKTLISYAMYSGEIEVVRLLDDYGLNFSNDSTMETFSKCFDLSMSSNRSYFNDLLSFIFDEKGHTINSQEEYLYFISISSLIIKDIISNTFNKDDVSSFDVEVFDNIISKISAENNKKYSIAKNKSFSRNLIHSKELREEKDLFAMSFVKFFEKKNLSNSKLHQISKFLLEVYKNDLNQCINEMCESEFSDKIAMFMATGENKNKSTFKI